MRPSPQDALSCAIACSCTGVGGRSGRDFQRQNRRNPWRCHRTKVRGCTTPSASLQSKGLGSSMSASRNGALGGRGFRLRSWYIASCLRRTRFSAASAAGGRRRRQKHVARSRRSLIVVRTTSIMVNIMPFQARRSDPLEMASSKATGSDFCGGQPLTSVSPTDWPIQRRERFGGMLNF